MCINVVLTLASNLKEKTNNKQTNNEKNAYSKPIPFLNQIHSPSSFYLIKDPSQSNHKPTPYSLHSNIWFPQSLYPPLTKNRKYIPTQEK